MYFKVSIFIFSLILGYPFFFFISFEEFLFFVIVYGCDYVINGMMKKQIVSIYRVCMFE